MSRTTSIAALAAWICFGAAAIAHHSVGINFDTTKAFNLTGVLKEIDIRNPHSQITLVGEGNGRRRQGLVHRVVRQERADPPQGGLRADEDRRHRHD